MINPSLISAMRLGRNLLTTALPNDFATLSWKQLDQGSFFHSRCTPTQLIYHLSAGMTLTTYRLSLLLNRLGEKGGL